MVCVCMEARDNDGVHEELQRYPILSIYLCKHAV